MPDLKPGDHIAIRDLQSLHELKQAEELEREVWGLSDIDVTPATFSIASREAGGMWIGAFDGAELVAFIFGFLGVENGRLIVHSHMMGVREAYRNLNLGYRLKMAQRDRALSLRINDSGVDSRNLSAIRIKEITWTFDPLHSRNAHFNFSKLGVVSDRYVPDFYGPATSSALHQNSTDRLWVRWPISSRRVQHRLQGKESRKESLDLLTHLMPLVQFYGDSKPIRRDLDAALSRQRIAIEMPSDILSIEKTDGALAREWREATRWAFMEALKANFFVAEFCRNVRGQQGPGVYILEKGNIEEYVPEISV
jgi:predicted GNAT superfamily acetyltransferase